MSGTPARQLVRQRSRGPVVLEPIVLPPDAPSPEPPPPPAPAPGRRGPPPRPLLQRPDDDAPARWWCLESDDEDEDDSWQDLARSLPSVLQYGSPDCLPMDHTLPHLLTQVAGTDDLPSVQSIKLRVIGREMSLQRLCVYVPNLTELNLDGSSVGSLRDLGCGLSGLRVLRVTRCGLDSLDGTFGLPSLAELYAAYNRVQDIGYLACLPSIELIDLRGNRVSDIRYAGFLTVCPFLRELVLAENPCAPRPGYRATIREMLPALASLDGMPLGDYQQDDDTDTFTETGEDEEELEGDEKSEVHSVEANEQTTNKTHDEEYEDVESGKQSETASETDDSVSTGSASSRGGPVDAIQLWKQAEQKASEEAVLATRLSRPGPLLLPRPATASCATPRRPHPHSQLDDLLKTPRPSSARAASESSNAGIGMTLLTSVVASNYGNASENARSGPAALCLADSVGDTDAPSPLTSGGVVCGNLSLALRKTRKRKEAWGQTTPQPASEQMRRESSSSSSCSSLSSSLSTSDSTPVDGTCVVPSGPQETLGVSSTTLQPDCQSLLAASRKWRNAYHQYRVTNKSKWDEEKSSEKVQAVHPRAHENYEL